MLHLSYNKTKNFMPNDSIKNPEILDKIIRFFNVFKKISNF